jgi:NDP-sugar pyrophosphorylase family protein
MEDKKYELVEDNFIIHNGRKLYRIRALKGFIFYGTTKISEGELGGYIEGYHNLSQEGNCWVFSPAKIYENAKVKDSARVGGSAEVYGNAEVEYYASVLGHSEVYGNARIKNYAYILDAKIYGNTVVKGGSRVYEESEVFGNAVVEDLRTGDASKIYDNAGLMLASYSALNNVTICGNTEIHD